MRQIYHKEGIEEKERNKGTLLDLRNIKEIVARSAHKLKTLLDIESSNMPENRPEHPGDPVAGQLFFK